MGDYELHFAEEGRAPFGLRLRLPSDWTHKTTKDLVAHFIETYNKSAAPLIGAYGLVDVRTGRFYADDASLADVARDAPLSVSRRAPAVKEEIDVDAEYAFDDAGSDEVDAVDDEEPLEDAPPPQQQQAPQQAPQQGPQAEGESRAQPDVAITITDV